MLGSAVLGGLVFAVAGAPALLVLLATCVGGGAVPYAFVALRVRRRSRAFENQLPDLLTTIAASLKAGPLVQARPPGGRRERRSRRRATS